MKKLLVLLSFFMFLSALPVLAADAPLISKDELKAKLGTDNVVILDVRTGRDWSSSEFKIKGAVRAAAEDFDKWSTDYPKDQALVLYCA